MGVDITLLVLVVAEAIVCPLVGWVDGTVTTVKKQAVRNNIAAAERDVFLCNTLISFSALTSWPSESR